MLRVRHADRLWLGLCVLSLCAYMALSESVRAFGAEVLRLTGKFCG